MDKEVAALLINALLGNTPSKPVAPTTQAPASAPTFRKLRVPRFDNATFDIENGLKISKAEKEAIIAVMKEGYDKRGLSSKVIKVGKVERTLATQHPNGKSIYALAVRNRAIGPARVVWCYNSGSKRTYNWKARYNFNGDGNTVIEVRRPSTKFGWSFESQTPPEWK